MLLFISSIFILNLAEIWLPKARYETEISYFDFGIFDKTTKKSLVEFHDSKQKNLHSLQIKWRNMNFEFHINI